MSDNNQNLPTELSKAAVDLAKPIYDDAVSPLAKRAGKVGDTAGGLIEMAISPLTALVWSYDKIKKWLPRKLEEKLANTPKENIIQPPNYLAIPTLQKLVYTDNKELQDMFANLLANSMDIQTTDKAHPSFVEIISQLTPDEARLLKFITTKEVLPKIDVVQFFKENGKKVGFQHLDRDCSLLGIEAKLKNTSNSSLYFKNFERLGILEIKSSINLNENSYKNKSVYKELENRIELEIKEKKANLDPQKSEIELKKGFFELTTFGKIFLKVVTGKIKL